MVTGQGKLFMLTLDQHKLNPLMETDYVTEDELQRFLATYPDLLAGDQINPEAPRRWLLVAREMSVPDEAGAAGRWSLDHLFLDQDGIPTFVECKRASDTRARREVVAQMLDYAANGLVYWGLDDLRQAAAVTADRQGTSLDAQVMALIGVEDEEAVHTFWASVADNLRNGKVRLLFITDETPKELRRLVEFLNSKMSDVEVLAVEIKQFRGGGHTVLAPRVIGQTELTRVRKAKTTTHKPDLTPEEFLALCSSDARRVFNIMREQAKERGYTEKVSAVSISIRGKRKPDAKEVTFVRCILGKKQNQANVAVWLSNLDPEKVQEGDLRKRLLDLNVLREAGDINLDTDEITDSNAEEVLVAYQRLLELVDDLFLHNG